MYSVYDGYQKVLTESKKIFFAGANTSNGFVGSYSDIADERKLDRVYVIKGAAGTGKSTFMRKVAEACEKNGHTAERYLCGSDPDSLDCVVADGRIAVLDGTSPHMTDMQYPGCTSSIVDISRFWDNDILETNKEEVISCSTKKSAAYASAYRYIRAADQLEAERRCCAERIYDREKAADFIERLLRKIKVKSFRDGRTVHRFNYGLTMRGRWQVDLTDRDFSCGYSVTDAKGAAPLFMEQLAERITALGKSAVIYHMPIGNNVTAVSLGEEALITVKNRTADAKNINMLRFVSDDADARENYGRIKLAGKCEKACIDEAEELLASAARNHFRLEEIYKSAMDFPALMEYTNEITDEILTKLEK